MKHTIVNRSNCPACGANLIGNVIPEDMRREYGNRKNFTRLVECRDWNTKKLNGYECPDCGEFFKNEDHRNR